jgi:transposase
MAKPILDDELWAIVEPLLPPPAPRRFRYPGRKPIGNRQALTGILFVLKTGIQWEDLPQEMGCGSGMTCWRRLRDWQQAGVWQKLHEVLLSRLRDADKINWERAVIDSSAVRALSGGAGTGPNPTDRRKAGSKHHVVTDAAGVPLASKVTAANRHDVTQLIELVDSIPPVRGKRGRPRQRPEKLLGDRAYDSDPHRAKLRERGIRPVIARRRTEHGSGLGVERWVVERTISWVHQFRRLSHRYERRPEIHQALVTIACAIICFRLL